MKPSLSPDLAYDVVRSRRKTADIVVERDGRIYVRVPPSISQEHIEEMVKAKKLWIYKALAEWRDLNATRVLRDYRNGEGFLYLGRSYRLSLVTYQEEALLPKERAILFTKGFSGSWGNYRPSSSFSRLLYYSGQGAY